MFYSMIYRNSRRSRKENGLFFSSLVISIVAFYTILSISSQDVIRFLREMESDAVNKLLLLIPVFYGMTLCILFFLIYFACKYQFERRHHEFGVYLMLGMSRRKLFGMLLAEDCLTSILALVTGLPLAAVLSELISLVTARLVGLGIIGHQFSLSFSAILWTLAGFSVIKLAALLILSGRISREEIGSLLSRTSDRSPDPSSSTIYRLAAVCGIGMLAAAYYMAIQGTAWTGIGFMALTVLAGTAGTFLLFYGMRELIAFIVKKWGRNQPLHVFTFRQIQEQVIRQSGPMAVSSLLILAALCCFGAGAGIAATNTLTPDHVADYTFTDHTPEAPSQILTHIQTRLKEKGLDQQFSDLFEMKVGQIRTADNDSHPFRMDTVIDALKNLPRSEDRDALLDHLGYETSPYLICLSDYNHLLQLSGRPALQLKENEAAVYMDSGFTDTARSEMLNQIFSQQPETKLADTPLYLTGELQSVNLVADRSITLSFALILPDDAFYLQTQGRYDTYVNGVLDRQLTEDSGLMAACYHLNQKLDQTGICYESYLQTMGRHLFYVTASSYITIYLAVVFLVAANTIAGIQFLMNQQKTGGRYKTLIRLGATYEALCLSSRKQILWYMGLPVLTAAVSSLFGVRSLFTGLLSFRTRETFSQLLPVAIMIILLLCVVESVYMKVVIRSSRKYLLTFMQPQREE